MTQEKNNIEYIAGELWRCVKEDFEKEGTQLPDSWKSIGMAYGGFSRAIEILTTFESQIRNSERKRVLNSITDGAKRDSTGMYTARFYLSKLPPSDTLEDKKGV